MKIKQKAESILLFLKDLEKSKTKEIKTYHNEVIFLKSTLETLKTVNKTLRTIRDSTVKGRKSLKLSASKTSKSIKNLSLTTNEFKKLDFSQNSNKKKSIDSLKNLTERFFLKNNFNENFESANKTERLHENNNFSLNASRRDISPEESTKKKFEILSEKFKIKNEDIIYEDFEFGKNDVSYQRLKKRLNSLQNNDFFEKKNESKIDEYFIKKSEHKLKNKNRRSSSKTDLRKKIKEIGKNKLENLKNNLSLSKNYSTNFIGSKKSGKNVKFEKFEKISILKNKPKFTSPLKKKIENKILNSSRSPLNTSMKQLHSIKIKAADFTRKRSLNDIFLKDPSVDKNTNYFKEKSSSKKNSISPNIGEEKKKEEGKKPLRKKYQIKIRDSPIKFGRITTTLRTNSSSRSPKNIRKKEGNENPKEIENISDFDKIVRERKRNRNLISDEEKRIKLQRLERELEIIERSLSGNREKG